MTEYVNQIELRVIGMSRSGNHPIIDWIRRQVRGRICFLNCSEPSSNPFQTCRPLASGRRAVANYRPFHLRREAAGEWSQKDWLIYSYEDCFLTMVGSKVFEENRETFVGTSQQRINVLILRDPFNLFASRMRAHFSGVTPMTAVRIWKQHARQFSGERKVLDEPTVAISYNRWASDRRYRRTVAQQLGLRFTDSGFRRVPRTGGGSSFDGVQYQQRATAMPVLQRWRRMADDPQYRALFDEELVRLTDACFELDFGVGELIEDLALNLGAFR